VLYRCVCHTKFSAPTVEVLKRFQPLIARRGLFVAIGVAPILLNYFVQNGTTAALENQFSILIWFGLGLRYLYYRAFKIDALIGILLLLLFIAASAEGSRAALLTPLASLLMLYLYFSNELFVLKPWLLAGLFVLLNSLILFSDISLDIRVNAPNRASALSVEAYVDALGKPGNLVSLIDPFHESDAAKEVRYFFETTTVTDRYRIPYFSGMDSLASRFTSLPMLDAVCGVAGERFDVDWSELGSILAALLPNFGQDKDLIYSDRVTWQLGLRDWDNIGRPEMTNACELYTMTGWYGLFLIASFEFFVVLWLLAVIRRQLIFSVICVTVLPQVIVWITVTTTALSVAAYAFRLLPLTILMFWLSKTRLGRLRFERPSRT
jgi:hypothetical protein